MTPDTPKFDVMGLNNNEDSIQELKTCDSDNHTIDITVGEKSYLRAGACGSTSYYATWSACVYWVYGKQALIDNFIFYFYFSGVLFFLI